MYKLIEFTSEKVYLDMFLSLPLQLYRGDKNYVRENKSETINWLLGRHPCKSFLKQQNLLVVKGNIPVARGIVFVNEIGKFGSIGFFDCINDASCLIFLIDKAREFCKLYNIKEIYAPMNGSIYGAYRIMTKGFFDRPYLGEPYNKDYYYDILLQCGFTVARKWESHFVNKLSNGEAAKRFEHIKKLQRHCSLKVRRMTDFETDILILHKLVMNAFSGFFLFHEIDESIYTDLYRYMKKISDKRTMMLAFDKDGNPAGFGLAFPDYASKAGYLLKYAKRYILWFYGVYQDGKKSADPHAFIELLIPTLQYIFSHKKGLISAMMSSDSKALTVTKAYDYIHEYVLLKSTVD